MTTDVFTRQFQSFASSLRAFAIQLTRDKNDADDLYQDTVYKAIRYRHLYQPHTNMQAWMMTIMRNTFINDWRRLKRKQQATQLPITGVTLTLNDAADNQGESNVSMQELTQLVEQLDDTFKIPFLMAYRGYKYEEIADELQLPLGTIKSRIHQARKMLKAKVLNRFRGSQIADVIA